MNAIGHPAGEAIRQVRRLAGVVTLAFCLAAPVTAANIVVNGGFEAGDLTGWSLTGASTPFDGVECAGVAPEGNCDAFFGPILTDDVLSQTLPTSPGVLYLISFLLNTDGLSPSHFSASFGGAPLIDLVNPGASPFTLYSVTRLASAASTPLSFSFRDDLGFLRVDAITVQVPEPATWALIGLALAGLGFARRRVG